MDNPTLLETWDMLSEETVWVWVKDPRAGTMTKKRLGGKGGGGTRVLHITSDDRRFNQEQIVEENATTDPFTNGALKLRDATQGHLRVRGDHRPVHLRARPGRQALPLRRHAGHRAGDAGGGSAAGRHQPALIRSGCA
jgi:hypothetical protein